MNNMCVPRETAANCVRKQSKIVSIFGGSKLGVSEDFDVEANKWSRIRASYINCEQKDLEHIDTAALLNEYIYMTGNYYSGIVKYNVKSHIFHEMGIAKSKVYKTIIAYDTRLLLFTDEELFQINTETYKALKFRGTGLQKRMIGNPKYIDDKLFFVTRQGVMYVYIHSQNQYFKAVNLLKAVAKDKDKK